jgi:hypothetical protein
MTPPAANVNWNSQQINSLAAGITGTSAPNISQLVGNMMPYVVSGCVWTADAVGSTRNASMTAGTVMIQGVLLTVAAVTARTFTASNDTYIDLASAGNGTATPTYTTVTNNSLSPALANSGTSLNTIRVAVITVGASSIAANGNIGQGGPYPQFLTGGTLGSSTVASGSNGSNITATPLNVTSGASFSTGGGWCQVAHSGGQTYTIQYTSVSGNTLVGVTVLSGTGTVSTGDTVQQAFGTGTALGSGPGPMGVTDMLGNRIYPTAPYPGLVGYASFVNAYTTTLTTALPLNGLIAPFIIPAGSTARCFKLTFSTPYAGSSAAAGTSNSFAVYIGNSVSGGTAIPAAFTFKVAVASDGMAISFVATNGAPLAAGSYTAQIAATQGAAGTLTVGASYGTSSLTVELY